MINLKEQLNETKENIKTEYQKATKKKDYVLGYWIIIFLIILAFFLYANATKNNREETKDRFQQLEETIQKRFDQLDQRLNNQEQLIEGVKQAKAAKKAEEARLAALEQPARPAPSQPVRSPGNCESYRPLVAQYSWDVNVALAVMRAESGCNPNALSRTADRGLMQINWVHSAKVGGNLSLLFDPATNVRVAYQLYQASGWNPWSVFKNGSYLKYL